jgi:hypothetical protein
MPPRFADLRRGYFGSQSRFFNSVQRHYFGHADVITSDVQLSQPFSPGAAMWP